MTFRITTLQKLLFVCFLIFFGVSRSLAQTDTDAFITVWKTDNPGTSCDKCITIPTEGGDYSYDVRWEEGGTWETGITGPKTHEYSSAGTYTVAIRGDFPGLSFGNDQDKEKILSIEQWGAIQWVFMRGAFYGCSNLNGNATDAPDLSSVTNMADMFSYSSFNQDINDWDVSNVTNMDGMFNGASYFNQDLNKWNVSNVTSMRGMFKHAEVFNGNIVNWNVGNVTDMYEMFEWANMFNQDVGGWNVENVTNMSAMFHDVLSFNADLSQWKVGKVTNMMAMFANTEFNQDISGWNVSSVTDMAGMFYGTTAFN